MCKKKSKVKWDSHFGTDVIFQFRKANWIGGEPALSVGTNDYDKLSPDSGYYGVVGWVLGWKADDWT